MDLIVYLMGPAGLLLVLAGIRVKRHDSGRKKVWRDGKGLFVYLSGLRWRIGGDSAKGRRDASDLVGNFYMFLGSILLLLFAFLMLVRYV